MIIRSGHLTRTDYFYGMILILIGINEIAFMAGKLYTLGDEGSKVSPEISAGHFSI